MRPLMLCVARFPDLYTSVGGAGPGTGHRTPMLPSGFGGGSGAARLCEPSEDWRLMVGGCLDRVARPGRGRGRPDGTAGHPPAREYLASVGRV